MLKMTGSFSFVEEDSSQSKLVADRYLKRELLGEGTHGVVFKAIDTKVRVLCDKPKEILMEESNVQELKEVVGFNGALVWDTTKPDGTPSKLMNNSVLAAMGWEQRIPLKEWLVETYRWYSENVVKEQ